jgi:general secretion pathway protein G
MKFKTKFIRSKGFTLIEMLVVLVIIGLLASLVGPKLFGKLDSSKIQTAQTQVKMLKGSLETMRLDIGRFPTQSEGLILLNSPPTDEKIKNKWKGPYLDEDLPPDPWGAPYVYSVPGPNNKPFSLYSLGPDSNENGDGAIGIVPAGDHASKSK